MFMLPHWLTRRDPNNPKKIGVIFSIPIHSFIDIDRVFVQFERRLKKFESLVQPAMYEEIYFGYGTIIKPSKDYTDHNWKNKNNAFLKLHVQCCFEFSPTKRFFITNDKRKKCLCKKRFSTNPRQELESLYCGVREVLWLASLRTQLWILR